VTAIHPPLTERPTERAEHASVATLRGVFMADAGLTAVAGVAVLAASETLADEAGLATTGPLLGIGGFFVGLAIVVAILGRLPACSLVRAAPLNAIGDLAWVAGSVAVAVMADLSGAGRTMVLAQAVAVLAVGAAKLWFARRSRADIAMSR
jgi:hypothetical protein